MSQGSALRMVLAGAALLRLWGIDFGLPHTLTRPDEEAVLSIGLRFFQRDFNPGFFHWPSFFLYVVAAAYVLYFSFGRLAGWFRYEINFVESASLDPAPLFLIPRLLSAMAGVTTVAVIYRTTLRLFDPATALVAALYLAVIPLHVRDAHFGVTDVAATLLLTLSFLHTVKYAAARNWRDALWSAALAGLAASTKYNAGLVVLPAILVLASGRESRWSRVQRVAGYGAVTAVAFLAGTPYAVLDWPAFITGLEEITAHLRGGHQILDGSAWRIHVESTLPYGVGWAVLTAAAAGCVWYAWRQPVAASIFGLFPAAYFVAVGSGQSAFARYMLPIVPFLCIAAAHGTVEAARLVARMSGGVVAPRRAVVVIAAGIAAPSLYSSVMIDTLLSRTDNRLVAADWIHAHFPGPLTLYQTGSVYGHIQMETAAGHGQTAYRPVTLDETTGLFRDANGATFEAPELIVMQESPLEYSNVPERVRRFVDDGYRVAQRFVALEESGASRTVYDRDDAFFVPLAGFDGVQRPGPNFTVYVRDNGGRPGPSMR